MPELLTLRECHCGGKKLKLIQLSLLHFEVRCTKCADYAWGNTPDFAVKRWNDMQGKDDNPNLSVSQPGTVKDCCKHSINLIDTQDGRKDVRVRQCRICGCKHISFKADPGVMGLKTG
jgi:hypothetical protein